MKKESTAGTAVGGGVVGGEEEELYLSSDSILARKLQKILSAELESDKTTLDSLNALSHFFTENSLFHRRFLRGEIERRSLEIHRQFLHDFGHLNQGLEEVSDRILDMKLKSQDMKAHLDKTKGQTRDLIQSTNALKRESAQLRRKQEVLAAFQTTFALSSEDERILIEGQPSEGFFQALADVRRVQTHCQAWIKDRDPSSDEQVLTAQETLQRIQEVTEVALRRTFQWAQAQCQSIEALGPSRAQLLPMAMRWLQERPDLFSLVLEDYCAGRRLALVRSFIDALTVGGVGGTPRPIELHAHDPPRYVGDMLAWIHLQIPTENENLQLLLRDERITQRKETCLKSIGSITEDICRPLTNRVEQILLLEASPLTLFRLINLLHFYSSTMGLATPKGSTLINTLECLEQLANKQFFKALISTVSQSVAQAEAPNPDLAPNHCTLQLLALLKDLLASSTMTEDATPKIKTVIDTVLRPLLESVQNVAAPFPTTDRDVFLLNSFYQIHSTLSLYHGTEDHLVMIQGEIDLRVDTLTSEQTSKIIANLGIQPICSLISAEHEAPLAKVPGMNAAALKQFMHRLDAFLVNPEEFLMAQSKYLISSSQRREIYKRSMGIVVASYHQIFESVMEPKSGYENPKAIMGKTPEQISLLLHL
ncbi:hypothetical protein TCAL_02484 [Tigriopus californicus]|uniref:Conserved oligomeric Golgi complex subunit 6 n=2 Tax=Tigriopus californicus TaxID=6832 RepID=A0A553NS45_TIGCA|nr:hypothetical protein TCAL_02484 [Tigriopus californicus]|eukprot:TCALIF_02484-PA protein Name:"Similar to Cog6 Conserved oligomeric Golgi complex subunit 6 (Mus musculus)" AED:0.02 eAED:0.02 QI:0/-1/0/1/-1/1/1/0/650